MAEITKKQIEELAVLARLNLSAAEINQLQSELSSILDYVTKIQELDTSKIPAPADKSATRAILRPDTVDEFVDRTGLIDADRLEDGLVIAKAVFERDGD